MTGRKQRVAKGFMISYLPTLDLGAGERADCPRRTNRFFLADVITEGRQGVEDGGNGQFSAALY